MPDTITPLGYALPISGASTRARAERVALALRLNLAAVPDMATAGLAWSKEARNVWRLMLDEARRAGGDAARLPPYASLRALLQIALPEALLVAGDLGKPWSAEAQAWPIVQWPGTPKDGRDAEAARAVADWVRLCLRPWAERRGASLIPADRLTALAEGGECFEQAPTATGLLRETLASADPGIKRRGLIAARRGALFALQGTELFPGLGPCWRIVSDGPEGDGELQTWPLEASTGDLWSMVARLEATAVPGDGTVYLSVTASRRRWARHLPEGGMPYRYRSVGVHLMSSGDGAPHVATVFAAPIDRQRNLMESLPPSALSHALRVSTDLLRPLPELLAKDAPRFDGAFIGFPFANGLRPESKVGTGASTRDHLDLFDLVSRKLDHLGWRPARFREIPKRLTRGEEFHASAHPVALLDAMVAGVNDRSPDRLADAWSDLFDAPLPDLSAEDLPKAADTLRQLRGANAGRVTRAYQSTPHLAVLASSERERRAISIVARILYGDSLAISDDLALPSDVHGAKEALPHPQGKSSERFAARVAAWEPLASRLRERGITHVLVQAPKWYRKKPDDLVNKAAGRHAIATLAEANAQYLLPEGTHKDDQASYLHRVAASLQDLIFGHSGLVTEVKDLLALAFPSAPTRPRAIIGVSVVTQARSRGGGRGGRILLATRVDAETGRTTGRLGWHDGNAAAWHPEWLHFFDLLKAVSSPTLGSLGDSRDAAADTFQRFVDDVVTCSVRDGDRPLVMIDATTARGLWGWLDTPEAAPWIGPERLERSRAWIGARILRVQDTGAPRLVERKGSEFQRIGGDGREADEVIYRAAHTITPALVQADAPAGAAAHYWLIGTYLERVPRGLSVWRSDPAIVKAPKARGVTIPDAIAGLQELCIEIPAALDLTKSPYRTPRALSATICMMAEGDDSDMLARLVMALRQGYGHTSAITTLPAPLFFEAKVRDYTSRFAIAEAAAEAGEIPSDEGGPVPPQPPTDEAEGEEDAEDALESSNTAAPHEPEGEEVRAAAESPLSPPSREVPDVQASAIRMPGISSGKAASWVPPAASPHLSLIDVFGADEARYMDPSVTLMQFAVPGSPNRGPRGGRGALSGSSTIPLFAVQSGDASKAPLPERREEREGAGVHEKDSHVPSGPVDIPDFVDHDWIARNLDTQPRTIRHLHQHRHRFLSKCPGLEWPGQKPDQSGFIGLLRKALRYPFFGMEADRILKENAGGGRKGSMASIMRPGLRRLYAIIFEHRRAKRTKPGERVDVHRDYAEYVRDLAQAADEWASRDFVAVHLCAFYPMHGFEEVMPEFEALETVRGWYDALVAMRDNIGTSCTCPTCASRRSPEDDADEADDTGEMTDDMECAEDAATSEGAEMAEQSDSTDQSAAPDPATRDVTTMPEQTNAALDLPLDAGAVSRLWQRALDAAADAAVAGQEMGPSETTIAALRAALEQAERAWGAFEAMRPKTVALVDLVDRARELAGVLRAAEELLCRLPPREAEGYPTLAAEAREALDIAAGEVERAAEKRAEEKEALRRYLETDDDVHHASHIVLKAEVKQAMEEGLAALTAAIDHLEAAAAVVTGTNGPGGCSPPPGPCTRDEGSPTVQPAEVVIQTPVPALATAAAPAPVVEMTAQPPGMLEAVAGDEPLGVVETSDDLVAAAVEEEISAAIEQAGPSEVTLAPLAPPVFREEDPLLIRTRTRLVEFFEAGEFGLAHHLARAAAVVFPGAEFPLDAGEMRLVAAGGHTAHGAFTDGDVPLAIVKAAEGAVSALREVGFDHPMASARRLALFGSALEFALFHPTSLAGAVLQGIGKAHPEVDAACWDLARTLSERRGNLQITPAILRAFVQAAEGGRASEQARKAALGEADAFSRLHFNFGLATKIRAKLCERGEIVGRLIAGLGADGEDALAAANAFLNRLDQRDQAMNLLVDAEKKANTKFQGIDGPVREKLISHLLAVSAAVRNFVETAEAGPRLERGALRADLSRWLSGLGSAVEKARAEVAALVPVDAAEERGKAVALEGLDRLRMALEGRYEDPSPTSHMVTLHGPLLWVSDLHFGKTWLPAVDDPASVLQALIASPCPPVRTPATFERLVKERIESGSLVGAARMLEAAPHWGIPDDLSGKLRDLRQSAIGMSRQSLETLIVATRRRVEAVQRMGAAAAQEKALELSALLDRIQPKGLPAEGPLSALPDAPDSGEEISDFVAARAKVREVELAVHGLREENRREIRERLDRLEREGGQRPEDIASVRGMLEREDLMTAEEWVGFLEKGETPPAESEPFSRFRQFWPAVPAWAGSFLGDGRDLLDAVDGAIGGGTDLGPLKFSSLDPARRQGAKELLDAWRTMRMKLGASPLPEAAETHIANFLGAAGLRPGIFLLDKAASNPQSKFWVFDGRLDIGADRESVLLPDFGSRTRGEWRVAMSARMPAEGDLQRIVGAAGAGGRLLFVGQPLSEQARERLRATALRSKLRLLVVDEAILIAALGETQPRPLTLLELAQPFAFSQPYADHGKGAVPREMFVGRTVEADKIEDPNGPCVVYGGRRLGKTALLKSIEDRRHDPDNGILVAHVDAYDVGRTLDASHIWRMVSERLKQVFPQPVTTDSIFSRDLRAWLDAAPRRRALLLIDEADAFVVADAGQNYKQFRALQDLMDRTERRFKVVFAGLHNVTRLVRSENPPTRHIASDPQRIGPLMGREIADAERLIVRPLAAMGYHFSSRQDVWRVLSHTNYYPVLAQEFCRGLLEIINREVRDGGRNIWEITSGHVDAAIEDRGVSKEIEEKFHYTLLIDERYMLLALILASDTLRGISEGRIVEGMSVVEIAEMAALAWEAAFPAGQRLSSVEDLLDEMEGLGVVRRAGTERWALRSPTILRLLGSAEKVESALNSFLGKDAPTTFEPRTLRRPLPVGLVKDMLRDHVSPLTSGQEREILEGEAPVCVLFGCDLADLAIVPHAIAQASNDASRPLKVEIFSSPTLQSFTERLGATRLKNASPMLLIVGADRNWGFDWVDQTIKNRRGADEKFRILFVGSGEHAERWAARRIAKNAGAHPKIRLLTLAPWSTAMLDLEMQRHSILPQVRADLLRSTGGLNRPMLNVLRRVVGGAIEAPLKAEVQRLEHTPDLLARLGLEERTAHLLRRGLEVAVEGQVTIYEVAEAAEVRTEEAARAVQVGQLLGLLDPAPVKQADEELRPWQVNSLLALALTAKGREAA